MESMMSCIRCFVEISPVLVKWYFKHEGMLCLLFLNVLQIPSSCSPGLILSFYAVVSFFSRIAVLDKKIFLVNDDNVLINLHPCFSVVIYDMLNKFKPNYFATFFSSSVNYEC
ncbi:hypothetical protein VIGAN_06086800 [Vigna angularis var. angularis]|uniref:Uncharacterized protein n=1 Tax=Vigna angularis var. angularis TaxID=157739 RepID=A0A0S3SAL1_PHAAN|nr:hypothetical protein VIGAN_06086800 [Vigna angularis var. angularis]